VSEFQQLPQDDATVTRKLSEAARMFDLENVKCFACSKETNTKTELIKTFAECINFVERSVKDTFKQVRSEQSDVLTRHIYGIALKEALASKEQYLALKSSMNEERQIAHITIESIKILSRAVRSEFSSLKNNIYASMNEMSWERLRPKIMDEKGSLPQEDRFFEKLEVAIKETIEAGIRKIKQFQVQQVSKKLEGTVQDSKRSLEKNYQALCRIRDVNPELLNQMEESINNDSIFDEIRQKCLDFEENYVQALENEASKTIATETKSMKLKVLHRIRNLKPKLDQSRNQEQADERNANRTDTGDENATAVDIKDGNSAVRPDENLKIIEDKRKERGSPGSLSKITKLVGNNYTFLMDQAFDMAMNEIISSISYHLINYAEVKIDEAEFLILNNFTESIDQYCQNFLRFYSQFASENESRFININNFINQRVL